MWSKRIQEFYFCKFCLSPNALRTINANYTKALKKYVFGLEILFTILSECSIRKKFFYVYRINL